MGFPNPDLKLVSIIVAGFAEVKVDPDFYIDDLFEDLEPEERLQIKTYIMAKNISKDLRKDIENPLFVAPEYPQKDIPFPQISITIPKETSEMPIANEVGDSIPVYVDGVLTYWDLEKVYFTNFNLSVEVLCQTKKEAIWISRFCQLFVCRSLAVLDVAGIKSILINTGDLRVDKSVAPFNLFNRAVLLQGKLVNTWKERILVSEYATGINIIDL